MTIHDIGMLIRNDETRTLELKQSTGELKDGMHSACAFLNTASGWLVFGIVSIAIYDDRVEIENSGVLPSDVTLEELVNSHTSYAHNPLIAQVLYFGKYMETWGRGIELMQEQCDEASVPSPQFIAERNCFRVTFVRTDFDEKGGTKGGTIGLQPFGLSDFDLMLLDMIEGNPQISLSEMSKRIRLTRNNTYKHVKKLQAKGYLLREGSERGGVWIVLKKE